MVNFDLKHYLLWGYKNEMEDQQYLDLRNSLRAYEKGKNLNDVNELSAALIKDYPQLQILHEAYVRNKLNTVSSSVKTIKTIVIVYFICSLFFALIYFLQWFQTL